MKQQPTIVIMIGLPCSGKTSYIEERLKNLPIVSFDANLMRFFSESEDYNAAQKQYESLTAEGKKVLSLQSKTFFFESLLKGVDFIVDYTNLQETERWEKWLQFIPETYRKVSIIFDISYEVLLERNEERNLQEGKHIPLQIMEMMRDSFEPLSPKEKDFFDEIIVVT